MFLGRGRVPHIPDASLGDVDGIWMGLILAPHRLPCTNIKIYIKSLFQMHFLPKYGIVPTGDRYVLYDE